MNTDKNQCKSVVLLKNPCISAAYSLEYAQAKLKTKFITLNLIRQMHSILMKDVRGHNRARGEFRNIQNWICPPGTPIEQANYVPPRAVGIAFGDVRPPAKVLEYMENLEHYINSEHDDYIIQAALVHSQFECIHPFVDKFLTR